MKKRKEYKTVENLDESLNSFREYMDRISDSKLDMILSAIDETGIEGPSVEEYFANITELAVL